MKSNKNWIGASIAAGAMIAIGAVISLLDFGHKADAQPRPGFGLLTPQPVLISGVNASNSISFGTVQTFNPPIKIDLSQGTHDALQLRFQGVTAALDATNTKAISLGLGRNIDGYNPGGTTNSEGFLVWGVTPNGTTQVTACTNLLATGTPYMGAIPYLYIYWLSNSANAGAITNFSVVAVSQ